MSIRTNNLQKMLVRSILAWMVKNGEIKLTVVADEDGVFFKLGDRTNVHQLVPRHDRGHPVGRLQLVRMEPEQKNSSDIFLFET